MHLRSVIAGVARTAPARGRPGRAGGSRWTMPGIRAILDPRLCGSGGRRVRGSLALLAAAQIRYVYFDRDNLPDLGPFTRFEFPTIGHVYDAGGQPLIELAREYRADHAVRRTFRRSCVTRSWPPRTSASSPTTASTTSVCRA